MLLEKQDLDPTWLAGPRRTSPVSQRLQERDEIGSLLIGEDEAQMRLVVAHDIVERRGNAVVEVGRPRRERAQRRRLESAEIAPQSGDVAAARIGQLPLFARRAVADGVERQIRRPRLG